MHKLWGVAAALLVAAGAAFAAAAQAASTVATGDTCVANGTGSQYTLTIQLGANAPQQDGFAVGVQGGKVTDLTIGGIDGKTSSSGLPAGTDAAWLVGSPQGVPGAQVTVNVHASISTAKAFTVVPYNQAQQTWFDPVACPVSKLVSNAGSTFTIGRSFAYRSTAPRGWSFTVSVPTPGTVTIGQQGGTKLLIVNRHVKVAGGTAKLMLLPTAAGRTALAAGGPLKLKLSIEFSPSSGIKPTTKTLSVALKR